MKVGEKMRVKIEIIIEQEKDGSMVATYNGIRIGEVDNVKPIDEISELRDIIVLREKLVNSIKLSDNINEEIQRRLVRLLAWYYTE